MKNKLSYAKETLVFIFALLAVIYMATIEPIAAQAGKQNPLLSMSYKTMTEADLGDAFMKASDYEVGQFLYSLTEQQRRELIQNNQVLNIESVCNTYRYQNKSFKPFRQERMPYYEMAMNVYSEEMAMQSADDIVNEGVYAPKSSGTYRMNLYDDDELTWKSTIKISGVDTTKDLSEQQNIWVSESMTGRIYGGLIVSNYGVENTAKLSMSPNRSDGQYRDLVLSLTYQKREGYYVVLNTENNSSYGDFMIMDESGNKWTGEKTSDTEINGKLTSYVDILYNTTLGARDDNTEYGREAVFHFNFKPCEYKVDFDGNGATSGATVSQKCVYSKDYYYPSNGFQRKYRVSFDGNGGNVSDAHKDCTYSFVGWGEQKEDNTTKQIHKEGTIFYNLTSKKDERIKRYALWEPDSITLPKAEREGYRFVGWSKEQTEKQTVLNAYEQYIPEQDETLYAIWEKEQDNSIDTDDKTDEKDIQKEPEKEETISGNDVSENQEPQEKNPTVGDAATNNSQTDDNLLGKKEIRQKDQTIVCEVGKDKEVVIKEWKVNDSIKSLSIPKELRIGNQLCKVTRIESNCICGGKKLSKISIDCTNLTSIGKNAFRGLTNLKTVQLKNAAKLQYIPDGCFQGCKSLSRIEIPKGVKKIGRKAFYRCSNLKKVSIKTKKLTYVGSKAFVKCHKDLKIIVPNAKKKAYQKLFRIL